MANRFELCVIGLGLMALTAPQLAGANGGVKASMVGMGAPARVETTRLEANDKVEQGSEQKSAPRVEAVPVWLPRRSGNRAARVGGATRGTTQDLKVHALVPRYDDAALTLEAQPTLYWHVSGQTPYAVNFTLVDPNAIDPLVDVTIEGPFESGVHALDLSAYPVQLEPGNQYQWFVAVMPDPERRSADIIARGAVERVNADAALQSALEGRDDDDRVDALTRGGIWYDALHTLNAEVEQSPAKSEPRARRDALLQQVGLDDLVRVE